jgi:hypothetical protein
MVATYHGGTQVEKYFARKNIAASADAMDDTSLRVSDIADHRIVLRSFGCG